MLRACLFLITASALAQEPAAAPDAGQIMMRLDWTPASLAEFEKLDEQAVAAGIHELDLLIPRVEAYLIFGDIEKLRPAYKAAAAAKSKILARKAGENDPDSAVVHTLKIAKKLLAFADKRPADVGKRTALFRNLLFAYQTREDMEAVHTAVFAYAEETKAENGKPVSWDDIRKYMEPKKHLAETGTTVFGDKIEALKTGEPPLLPKATWEKLKDFVPPDYWGKFAPYAKEAP